MLEQIADVTSAGLERLDRRLDGFDHRMDGFDRRLDGFDRRFEGVERGMDMIIAGQRLDFRWMVGLILICIATVVGMFGALLGVMAHGFRWLQVFGVRDYMPPGSPARSSGC